jgi:hypothetical protein
MDDSLLDLENELKRLRPRAPSTKLLRRIQAGVAAPESRRGPGPSRTVAFGASLVRGSWFDWRAAAAVAAVVTFATVLVSLRRPARVDAALAALPTPAMVVTVPTVDRYQPVGASSVLYDLQEDRVVTVPDSTPARRLRYRYVDTYTWKNPATNASLKWSLPRDEVRVLPVSLH